MGYSGFFVAMIDPSLNQYLAILTHIKPILTMLIAPDFQPQRPLIRGYWHLQELSERLFVA